MVGTLLLLVSVFSIANSAFRWQVATKTAASEKSLRLRVKARPDDRS